MASAYFKLRLLKKKRVATIKKGELYDKDDKHKTVSLSGKKCRICLEDGNLPIYGDDSLIDCYEYIRLFAGIEISENDDFPKYLCNTCHSLLQNAILFREKAKSSDSILRRNMKCEQTFDSESIEIEGSHADSTDDDNYFIKAPKSYKCKSCNINFMTRSDYIEHKNCKQHKNVRIQCPICFGLLTSQLYKKHLARHQSAAHLVCEVCGKLYRKDNLVRHLQLHSSNLPFQCQLCPYRGRFGQSLRIHMRTHTGDKPYSCDKCHLRFLTKSNLNRHLLTHTKERPFKCNECGRCYYLKRELDTHFKADHVGIKDFVCSLCGNKYSTRKALMKHELLIHKRNKLAKGRMPLYLQAEYKLTE